MFSMRRVLLCVPFIQMLLALNVFADGKFQTTALFSVSIKSSVWISPSLTSVTIHDVDVVDLVAASASTNFVVRANSYSTKYDVWLSVPQKYLDPIHDVYLAKQGPFVLPLDVRLRGDQFSNPVDTNPAAIQTGSPITARPRTGSSADGDNVGGAGAHPGTTYTITLTEDMDTAAIYFDIPGGIYTMEMTANVAQED